MYFIHQYNYIFSYLIWQKNKTQKRTFIFSIIYCNVYITQQQTHKNANAYINILSLETTYQDTYLHFYKFITALKYLTKTIHNIFKTLYITL